MMPKFGADLCNGKRKAVSVVKSWHSLAELTGQFGESMKT